MQDITKDEFGSRDENGIVEVANLSLDEPELEVVFFNDDDQEEEELRQIKINNFLFIFSTMMIYLNIFLGETLY